MQPQPAEQLLSPRVVARVVLTIVAVLGGLYLIWLLRKPLSWLVLASFIAITLSAPVNVLSRYMRRGAAITLTYLGVLLIPVAIGAIIVPPIVTQASNLASDAPGYAKDVRNWVQDNRRLRELDDKYDITDKLEKEAGKLPTKIGDAAGTLSDIGIGIVNGAFAMLNILILSIFLVASGRRWLDRFVEWRRPKEAERIKLVADRVGRTVANYIGGALLQATIAAVVAFVVMTILGVPFAAPLAVLTFFMDLIPLVGATVGAVIVGLVTLFHGFPTTTIVWVVFAVIYQQLENTVIQPQIQRRAANVHPFAVLFGVLCGATLFGVFGALLAIPVIASGEIALREWMSYRRELADAAIQSSDEPPPPAAAATHVAPEPI